MSSMVVFKSLREMFPQVDDEILKAASFEHAGDLDAAVHFILLEVIPYLPEPDRYNLYEPSPEDESDLDDGQNLYYSIINTTPPKREGLTHPTKVHANEGMCGSTSSEGRNWDVSVLIGNNRALREVEDFDNYSRRDGEDGGDKVGLKEDEADGLNGNELITSSTHSANAEILEDIVYDAKSSKDDVVAPIRVYRRKPHQHGATTSITKSG